MAPLQEAPLGGGGSDPSGSTPSPRRDHCALCCEDVEDVVSPAEGSVPEILQSSLASLFFVNSSSNVAWFGSIFDKFFALHSGVQHSVYSFFTE